MEELGLKGLGNCLDSDDEFNEGKDPSSPSGFLCGDLNNQTDSVPCKLALTMKTTMEGYWKIDDKH